MRTPVASFYRDVDDRSYYSRSAERLRRQLDTFGVPHEIVQLPSLGSYRLNCLSKPGFILERLRRTMEPFVWVDVDTVVRRPPVVFDRLAAEGVDVGVATMTDDVSGLQSTPLFLGPSAGALGFLEAWVAAAEHLASTEETGFDHEALISVFPTATSDLKVAWLGPEYCGWPGRHHEGTVIELGLSDEPSKIEVLRRMGHSESLIALESPGFVDDSG